jgi:hypothetical protein
MVSSTFLDLVEHRAALIQIIERRGLKAIPMEYDAALPAGDVIDSSLGKVRDGAAYVGIIAKRYGQIPPCSKRNPRKVSITELEFDEAVRLGRPILLFPPPQAVTTQAKVDSDPIPPPPAFYAEPPYLGSHDFVGRRDQLETLDAPAGSPAIPPPSKPISKSTAIATR